jgi:hypothetical protein
MQMLSATAMAKTCLFSASHGPSLTAFVRIVASSTDRAEWLRREEETAAACDLCISFSEIPAATCAARNCDLVPNSESKECRDMQNISKRICLCPLEKARANKGGATMAVARCCPHELARDNHRHRYCHRRVVVVVVARARSRSSPPSSLSWSRRCRRRLVVIARAHSRSSPPSSL